MQVIILFEDSYDLKWFFYHKYLWSKVKCWKEIWDVCYMCVKWLQSIFLSIIKVYDREEQKVKMIFLNQKSLINLQKEFQRIINERILDYKLKDTKNHIFEINKVWWDYKFTYIRKHNYKKFNIDDSINLNDYLKRNFVSYDCYGNGLIDKYKHLINEDEDNFKSNYKKEELESSLFIPIKSEYINTDSKLNELSDIFNNL